ncbi:TlpA family protein disulfide reductase [Lentibacillus sp. Marseille-P4043]|uniref:TlpA family protein disulfide reductase n=1 Tax=Lentibacillus sp. Marseille-P4043 TaxID=2040293 RepID=UPI000D0B2EA0|nr:TlpA disulfide reductase family protein [Lentibacillus sp. Marseille-P4043]
MKQVLGIIVIVLLAGIVIFNVVEKEDENTATNEDPENVSPDSDMAGAAIVPPGKTGVETGEKAPDFELETLSGETVKLSELKGQKVFLNFWASWCGPCRIEMPEMQKFYEEHQGEVEIIAVNTDTNKEKARKFIDEYDYTYPVLLDKKMKVSEQYMVSALPTTYFIGKDGKVQESKKVGPMTYDFMVDMLHSLE